MWNAGKLGSEKTAEEIWNSENQERNLRGFLLSVDAASPRAADTAEREAWGADVHHAIRTAAGFHSGAADIFDAQKQFDPIRERAADAQIADHSLAEPQRVFVIFELPADPPHARRHHKS